MSKKIIASAVVILLVASSVIAQSANEALFEAARAGDIARIEAALSQGASVNATSR